MPLPLRHPLPCSVLFTALVWAVGLVLWSPPADASSVAKNRAHTSTASQSVGKVSFVDSASSEKPAAR